MKPVVLLAAVFAAVACATDAPPDTTPDAVAPPNDAGAWEIDGRVSSCDVITQNCAAPRGCIWTGIDDGGMCRALGGLQGIGVRDVGEPCSSHAVCRPSLACITLGAGVTDAGIVLGQCQQLCLISAPSCPVCASIPGVDLVGWCS